MRLVTGIDVGDDEGMKISQCRVHSTGALVLDPNDYDALDDNLEYRAADARRENETRNPGAEARTIANETEKDAGAKNAMDDAVDDAVDDALGAAPMNDDDGDFGGARDFDVDGDDARATRERARGGRMRSLATSQPQTRKMVMRRICSIRTRLWTCTIPVCCPFGRCGAGDRGVKRRFGGGSARRRLLLRRRRTRRPSLTSPRSRSRR